LIFRGFEFLMGSAWTLIICVMIGFVMSCKDSAGPANPMACTNNAEKVSNAAAVLSADPTEANCIAYKNAIRDFLKSCPNFYTGANKAEIEAALDEPCGL